MKRSCIDQELVHHNITPDLETKMGTKITNRHNTKRTQGDKVKQVDNS